MLRWLLQRYKALVTLGFTLVFVIQLSSIVPAYIQPTELNTVMERRDLASIRPFPLVFRVCFKPGFNRTKMKEFGYNNMEQYFWGWMSDNVSDVGWAGRERDRGVRTPADLLASISTARDINELLAIAVFTGTYEETGNSLQFGKSTGQIDFKKILVDTWINWFDNCVLLDFLKDETIKKEGISQIFIDFHGDPTVEIIPEDRNLVTDRALQNNKLFYFGPTIAQCGL
jgi:hypothetical protein